MQRMSDDVTLGLAAATDVPGIARMSRTLIEQGLAWTYDVPRLRRLLARPDIVALVARDADGLAGFAIMQFGDEDAHLVLLAVQPRRQRQGLARRMLGWLLESARVAGVAEIRLEIRAGNAGARAFYHAFGFGDAGLLPGYYGGREAALRMVRVLRRATEPPPGWQAPTLRRH
jgi:ribosomal-protein-alanine N-acetyltransferase